MAKGDTYTVGVRGMNGGVIVEVTTNGRVLEAEFEKGNGGLTWLVITEKIGRTGKVTGVTRFNTTDVQFIQANFETE